MVPPNYVNTFVALMYTNIHKNIALAKEIKKINFFKPHIGCF